MSYQVHNLLQAYQDRQLDRVCKQLGLPAKPTACSPAKNTVEYRLFAGLSDRFLSLEPTRQYYPTLSTAPETWPHRSHNH